MTLFRNTFLMASTTALRLVTGFCAFVIVARHLGAEQFGTLMYWMTVSGIAALVVGFGSGPYMLKEIGATPQLRASIVGGVGASKVLLTLAVTIASLSVTPWLGSGAALYWLLLGTALSDVVAEYVFCAFRGSNDYLTEVWFSSVTSCTHLGLIVLAVWLQADLQSIAAVFMASRVAATGFAGFIYKRRFGDFGITAHWHHWRQTLLDNRAYAADAFLTNLYSQLDSLLLNHLSGPASLGIYQAGLRLMQGLNNLAPVLSNVYLPKIANELKNRQDHSRTAGLLYLQLTGFGTLVALVFALWSSQITDLIYGPSYASLKPLLPWFGALLLLRLFASNFGILLTASGQQSTRAWSNAACLVIATGCGFAFIPEHGALGMLWSAILATLWLAVMYMVKTVRTQAGPHWRFGQIAVSVAGFATVIALLARHQLSTF